MFLRFYIITNSFTTPAFLQEIQVARHTVILTFKSLKFELVKKNNNIASLMTPEGKIKGKKTT